MDFTEKLFNTLQGYLERIIELLPSLALAFVALVIALLVANLAKKTTRNTLAKRSEDPLLANFLGRIIGWAVRIIGFLIVLRIIGLGDVAGGILAGAGVSAFVIGFAFKDIGENFLAGILLAFSRPFRIGDTVEVNGVKGSVTALDLRNTHVKTFDGKDVYIPNAQVIKNNLYNYTIDGFLRLEFDLGIDYDSDYKRAIKIVFETLDRIDGVLRESKKPSVNITSLGSSTLNLTAQFWIDTFDKTKSSSTIKTEAINACLKALAEAGINMPGDVLEVKNYKDAEMKVANKAA